jgi:hypothetical protein
LSHTLTVVLPSEDQIPSDEQFSPISPDESLDKQDPEAIALHKVLKTAMLMLDFHIEMMRS